MKVKLPVTLGDMGAKGLEIVANEIVSLLRENDALNFMGMQLTDNYGTDWMLTVQRIDGETPEQQNGRLKAELAALKEQAELRSFYEICFDDVERIEKALLHLGESTPESKEERSARWRELLMRLTSAVLRTRSVHAELAALKAAALFVVHEQGDCGQDMSWALIDGIKELARLCGETKKYSRDNCPKSDTWFSEGGACGRAWDCRECIDEPKRLCGEG